MENFIIVISFLFSIFWFVTGGYYLRQKVCNDNIKFDKAMDFIVCLIMGIHCWINIAIMIFMK